VTLNVGVIGVGMIGQDHIRRLTHTVLGARVSAITDADPDRARVVADDLSGVRLHASGQDLIADPGVDAVLVTSWGPTHEEYVLASIAAGKQVFVEKPLATTEPACGRIVDAEVAAGRRLVQVGFMRRYDGAYRDMRQVVAGGEIGQPLIMHASHRNPAVPGYFTSDSIINDTMVHDIDLARWMFDDEVASVLVLRPRRSRNAPEGLSDPLIAVLEMRDSGVIVDVEASVNIAYGYDIRGEVVCESGTVELSESATTTVKRDGRFTGRIPADWRERFVAAFDTEFQDWVDSVRAGTGPTGPSSWDGYAATVSCDAAIEAWHNGQRVPVAMRDKPDLYKVPEMSTTTPEQLR
jgi:myo-inositol 2-dehydrogenase / D-chiro-inositol 1-dehydrogenase